MDNQQKIPSVQHQALTLPGVSNLLKRSWQIYKMRVGTFLGIMALPFIIGFLFLIPVEIGKTLNPIFAILLYIIFSLIVGIVGSWSQVSLLYAIKEREIRIGIKESFQRGWSKILPFIWISILGGFIATGGFLLFIVPAIIFIVWFIFGTPVLVSEEHRGMNALLRSKQWVSGYWSKVFWRWLAITVIEAGIILFVKILKIPFAENIISLLITPFSLTYSFLIYEDLKKLKGELPFEPPKRGTKIKFILVGIIGLLLILATLFSIISTSLKKA